MNLYKGVKGYLWLSFTFTQWVSWYIYLPYYFQIITLLKYIQQFSCLTESKIEGLEPYSAKFMQIFTSIKKKPYDVLDQRKPDFDQDFDDFNRQLTDLEVKLGNSFQNKLIFMLLPLSLCVLFILLLKFLLHYYMYGQIT